MSHGHQHTDVDGPLPNAPLRLLVLPRKAHRLSQIRAHGLSQNICCLQDHRCLCHLSTTKTGYRCRTHLLASLYIYLLKSFELSDPNLRYTDLLVLLGVSGSDTDHRGSDAGVEDYALAGGTHQHLYSNMLL